MSISFALCLCCLMDPCTHHRLCCYLLLTAVNRANQWNYSAHFPIPSSIVNLHYLNTLVLANSIVGVSAMQ